MVGALLAGSGRLLCEIEPAVLRNVTDPPAKMLPNPTPCTLCALTVSSTSGPAGGTPVGGPEAARGALPAGAVVISTKLEGNTPIRVTVSLRGSSQASKQTSTGS